MKTITITIGTQGETVVETSGFKGKACQDATKQIEQALGTVEKDVKKAEYYQQANVGQRLGQRS